MPLMICNIGVRDLRYNAGTLDAPRFLGLDGSGIASVATQLGCAPTVRAVGEALLARIRTDPTVWERLRFPLVNSAVAFVSQHEQLFDVMLVVTDQPKTEAHSKSDTVEVGAVIKQFLERRWPRTTVAIEKISAGPHLAEQAELFFQHRVPTVSEGSVYAFISGGIPQLNNALMWRALTIYRGRCRVAQIIEPTTEELETGADVLPVRVYPAHLFLYDAARQSIETLLDAYDLSGAFRVAESASSDLGDPAIPWLLAHVVARSSQQWRTASLHAADMSRLDDVPDWVLGRAQWVPSYLEQLRETVWMAGLLAERKDFTAMLHAVWTFQEMTYRFAAAELMGLPSLINPLQTVRPGKAMYLKYVETADIATVAPDYSKYVAGQRRTKNVRPVKVKGFLLNKRGNDRRTDHDAWSLSRTWLSLIVNWRLEPTNSSQVSHVREWRNIAGLLNGLNSLAELRNQTAHSFGRVSEADLADCEAELRTTARRISRRDDPVAKVIVAILGEVLQYLARVTGTGDLSAPNEYLLARDWVRDRLARQRARLVAQASGTVDAATSPSSAASAPSVGMLPR